MFSSSKPAVAFFTLSTSFTVLSAQASEAFLAAIKVLSPLKAADTSAILFATVAITSDTFTMIGKRDCNKGINAAPRALVA